jgi:hypothetical protein
MGEKKKEMDSLRSRISIYRMRSRDSTGKLNTWMRLEFSFILCYKF